MTYKNERASVISAIGLITIFIVGMSVSPATAAEPGGSGSDSLSDTFDSAQEAIGLSSDDATMLDPGISVTASSTSATTNLGDLSVTVTAQSEQSDTTIVNDGARVMSLLEDGESSARFTVDLPADTALVPSGGGYRIVGTAGSAKIELGRVESPWAVDANGAELPTSYTLEGTTLVQHVVTHGATYPIVADPLVSLGWGPEGPGVYLNLYGETMKVVAAATTAVLGLSVAGGCVAAGKIPRVGAIIQGICGFVGVPSLKSVISTINSIVKSTAISNSACYSYRVPGGTKFFKVDRGYCA